MILLNILLSFVVATQFVISREPSTQTNYRAESIIVETVSELILKSDDPKACKDILFTITEKCKSISQKDITLLAGAINHLSKAINQYSSSEWNYSKESIISSTKKLAEECLKNRVGSKKNPKNILPSKIYAHAKCNKCYKTRDTFAIFECKHIFGEKNYDHKFCTECIKKKGRENACCLWCKSLVSKQRLDELKRITNSSISIEEETNNILEKITKPSNLCANGECCVCLESESNDKTPLKIFSLFDCHDGYVYHDKHKICKPCFDQMMISSPNTNCPECRAKRSYYKQSKVEDYLKKINLEIPIAYLEIVKKILQT